MKSHFGRSGGGLPARVQSWLELPVQAHDTAVRFVRGRMDELASRGVPPLTREDVFAVVILEQVVAMLQQCAPRRTSIRVEVQVRCESTCVELAVLAHPEIAEELGLVAQGPRTAADHAEAHVWWSRWYRENFGRVDQPWLPGRTLRQRVLYWLGQLAISQLLPPADVLLEDLRRGRRQWVAEHGGGDPHEVEDDLATLAAEYWDLSTKGARASSLHYLHPETGLLRIGTRAVRDRKGRRQRAAGFHEFDEETWSPGGDDGDDEVLAGVDVRLAAEAIRSVVEERRDRAPQGSLDRLLLDHLADLSEGLVTPTELAEQVNAAPRTVREAWQRLRSDLCSDPRLRTAAAEWRERA